MENDWHRVLPLTSGDGERLIRWSGTRDVRHLGFESKGKSTAASFQIHPTNCFRASACVSYRSQQAAHVPSTQPSACGARDGGGVDDEAATLPVNLPVQPSARLSGGKNLGKCHRAACSQSAVTWAAPGPAGRRAPQAGGGIRSGQPGGGTLCPLGAEGGKGG